MVLLDQAIEAAKLFPADGPICFSSICLRSLALYFCDCNNEEFELAIKAAESIPNRSIRMETFERMIDHAMKFTMADPEVIDRMEEARRACSKYEFKNMRSCLVM